MYRLIYASKPNVDVSPELMKGIIKTAESNNEKRGVTGILFYNFEYFLQCLEGSREQVNSIFSRICKDDRHKNVEIILAKDVDARIFGRWNMALSSMTEINTYNYFKFFPTAEFNPYLLTDRIAEEFVRSLKQTSTHLSAA